MSNNILACNTVATVRTRLMDAGFRVNPVYQPWKTGINVTADGNYVTVTVKDPDTAECVRNVIKKWHQVDEGAVSLMIDDDGWSVFINFTYTGGLV